MGSSKSKKSVVGYRYFRSVQLGLCHGPLDAIRSIWIKDKIAWSGNLRATPSGASVFGAIVNPNLFGGEDLEGGVQGHFEVGFGGFNQQLVGVNSDGTTSAGVLGQYGVAAPFLPAMGTHYRGLAVLNLHDFYWGTNPYLGDVAVEVERYFRSWFPEVAQIGVDANPAHIIYEAVTNDQWGLAYGNDQMDLDSMRVSAGTLYAEGLGLSMAWSEQQTIEDFIGTILPQIDGSFYFNPRVGKWSLRLVRPGDPVVHRLDPSNFKLANFTRRGMGETVNELTVRWVSPETEEYVAHTVQDTANVMATGQTIPGSKNYPGVRTEALAAKLALRDLASVSATLAACDGTANREAWHLNPGDLVEFVWPAHNIELLRMRVSSTSFSQNSNDIKISLVEDVFGQNLSSFTGSNAPGWQDSRQPPGQFDYLVPFELPYWFVFQAAAGVIPAVDVTYGSVIAVSGNTNIQQVNLYGLKVSPTAATYELLDSDNTTPSALISADLLPAARSTVQILLNTLTEGARVVTDSYAVIGDGVGAEMVRVIGTVSGSFMIERGIMDTHPRRWPQGTRIYFIGDNLFPMDPTARSMAEVVDYKVTMQTSLGATTLDDVPVTTMLMEGRQGRPYSVANVTIAGEYWPETVAGGSGITVTWSTRNKVLQNGAFQVQWDEPSIAPEAGTTVLVFAMQAGQVVSSALVSNPAQNSVVLPTAGMVVGEVELHVRAILGDLENYQDFQHTFNVTGVNAPGWSDSWGDSWGS